MRTSPYDRFYENLVKFMILFRTDTDYCKTQQLENISELGSFAPIGTMEFWNIGIMGSGKMEWWVWGIKTNVNRAFSAFHTQPSLAQTDYPKPGFKDSFA
jgi:hypothetical protein